MNNAQPSPDPNLSQRRIVMRITAVAWAALVFYMSTERFGSDFSQLLLAHALTALHISVSPRTFHILDTLLRKLAHITEYAILAFFVYGSLAKEQLFRWSPRQALWCLGAVALYSLTDEFHQRFVPGRHASLVDSGIDIVGASIAIALIFEAGRLFLRTSTDQSSA